MKKFSTFFISLLLMIPAASIATSCSDDDNNIEETKPVVPPADDSEDNEDNKENSDSENGMPGISPEILEKINKIYSQASTGPQEIKSVSNLAIITSICAARTVDGPISVTKALFNNEPITLITLGGTENEEGQATTMQESQLAAFGKPNDYLRALVNLFDNGTISQDYPIIVTGISLGGMIAQQLLSRTDIVDKFNIRAIITFGSPFTLPLDRHGVKVVRFADVHDKVPQLGEMVLRSGMVNIEGMTKEDIIKNMDELDVIEKIVRESKYTDMIETHALSYIEDPCWNNIDFLGDKAKTNIIVLQEEMKFYPAPKSK